MMGVERTASTVDATFALASERNRPKRFSVPLIVVVASMARLDTRRDGGAGPAAFRSTWIEPGTVLPTFDCCLVGHPTDRRTPAVRSEPLFVEHAAWVL